MPVPEMIAGPMLGPFRAMAAEIDGKGLRGPDVDAMKAALARMEQLAREHTDIAAFSSQLAQENVMLAFSEAYGRALGGAARAAASAEARSGDDGAMLERALTAYEQALAQHRGHPASAPLVAALEQILTIGRSGVGYLAFCRELEERGLDRVLDGTAPLGRAALVESLALAQRDWDRWRSEIAARELAWLDEASANAPGGDVDPLAFTMASLEIQHLLEPYARVWSLAIARWEKALDSLVDWLDAFCAFAPHDERWRGRDAAETAHNIARTQACRPGEIVIRIELVERSGIPWDQLIEHDTFRWQYTARHIGLSDERLRLAFATRPHAVVGGRPPAELVARAEQLHAARATHRRDAGQRPAPGCPLTTLRWT